MTDLQRDIGRHDEAIETLKTEVHAMRQDLADIKRILAASAVHRHEQGGKE